MEFGKPKNPDHVNWKLPLDPEITVRTLARLQQNQGTVQPSVYVGSTAWAQKEFVGEVYPTGTRQTDFLNAYAKQFNTIELNTTFYRIPTIDQVANWAAQTPEDFRFCPKVFREISEDKDLGIYSSRIAQFTESIRSFGSRLGPCFMQLPPTFAPMDARSITKFIELWPDDIALAIEFRHPKWFEPKTFERITNLLAQRGIGMVITDVGGRRDVAHMAITQPYTMIRWVGNEHETDARRIEVWANRIAKWLELGLEKVVLFTHQPNPVPSAITAAAFIQAISKLYHDASIRGPQLPPPPELKLSTQISLF